MHLAGAFKIPSITLLGDWYDSANLHKQQWGYPESIVLGKETKEGITKIATIEEAFQQAQRLFKTRSSKVRICIISGTYNPGKCGISDYIQLLSEKLRDLGHEVSHASVHHLEQPNDFIQNYPNHDLYSIQFAPYAFSSNGVLNKSILKLAKILNSQKTHINFHEIWIGAYPKASFKEKFTGWRQKLKILTFFNNLNPNFITSTNAAAIDRLALAGIEADYLYLFGNIPLTPTYQIEEKNHAT